MSRTKEKKNATWTPIMTEFLLNYLVEQTKLGLKGQNGFKSSVLTIAAEEINKRFDEKLTYCNVHNHLKTTKKRWRIIQKLKQMDGVFFNERTKTIEMDHEEYMKYVEENPAEAKFINRHIRFYEQIQIVCGNSTEFWINNSEIILRDDNLETTGNENEIEEEEIQVITPISSESRKRKKFDENSEKIAKKKNIRISKTNVRWNPVMTEFLFTFLKEEIKLGHRNSNNKFTIISLSNAAEAINEKFEQKMKIAHIQNHLKTMRRRWRIIEGIKKLNGVNFNNDTKIINMPFNRYRKYIQENPSDEPFINQPIKYYDEMEIIFGNKEEINNENNSPNEISSPDLKMDGGDLELDVWTPHEDQQNGSRKRKKFKQIKENSPNNDAVLKKNASWSQELSDFLLKYMANEARMGFKGRNGFKSSAIIRAVGAIKEKFGKDMSFSNVQNHLKTIKKRWKSIQNLKEMSGVFFNQETNTLEMGIEEYQNHVQERPSDDQFINKPIRYLTELEIVCGNDTNLLNAPLIPLSPNIEFNSDNNSRENEYKEGEEEEEDFDNSIENNVEQNSREFDVLRKRKKDNQMDITNINNNNSNSPCEMSSLDPKMDGGDLDLLVEEMQIWTPQKKSKQIDENLTNNVGKKRNDANLKKNASWNHQMSDFLLKYLANEAQNGFKGKSGFKSSALIRASRAITEKFGKDISFSNVQNHMKTFKKRWKSIQNLKNMSGVIFNEETNTIEMGPQEYQNHVQVRPSDDQFINMPIKLLAEMEIVCGTDKSLLNTPLNQLSTNFESNNDNNSIETQEKEDNNDEEQHSKSFDLPKRNKTNQIIESNKHLTSPNFNNRDSINSRENGEKEEEIQHSTPDQNAINSRVNHNEESSNQSRKITINKSDPTAEKLLSFVGHVAESLKESSNSNDKTIKFAKEIMGELREIKGEFSTRALRSAQRYLVENSLDGACFMSYDKEEKISWMNDFISDNLGGNT